MKITVLLLSVMIIVSCAENVKNITTTNNNDGFQYIKLSGKKRVVVYNKHNIQIILNSEIASEFSVNIINHSNLPACLIVDLDVINSEYIENRNELVFPHSVLNIGSVKVEDDSLPGFLIVKNISNCYVMQLDK